MKSNSYITVVIVSVLLSAATALGITAFVTADVVHLKNGGAIEARAFRLIDAYGNVRALFNIDEGWATLTLGDSKDKARASLYVTEHGPNLVFYNTNGKRQAVLSATKDGTRLALYNAEGELGGGLVTTENESKLVLFDAKRGPRVIRLFDAVVLDVTTKGYQRLETSVGPFLICIKEAEKYLDGYKVKLNVANLTSATFEGLAMDVSWGKEPAGKGYTKEFSSLAVLKPGVWTPVEVLLSPAEVEDLKQVRVGNLRTSTVKMHTVQGEK